VSHLSNIEGRKIVKFVESLGYHFVRQRGSHQRYTNDDGHSVTVSVYKKKCLAVGVLKDLLRQLGVETNALLDFLQH